MENEKEKPKYYENVVFPCLFFVNFTSCIPNSTHFLVLPYLPATFVTFPTKENKKNRYKKLKTNEQNILLLKLPCGVVYHTLYPFVQTSLLANIHCNDSLLCTRTLASPVVALCPGSAGPTPSHAPVIHRCGRCLCGPTQSPGSWPGW